MNVNLSEAQIRYVMAKIEADVVAGNALADSVERELDLTLMDEEQREREANSQVDIDKPARLR